MLVNGMYLWLELAEIEAAVLTYKLSTRDEPVVGSPCTCAKNGTLELYCAWIVINKIDKAIAIILKDNELGFYKYLRYLLGFIILVRHNCLMADWIN